MYWVGKETLKNWHNIALKRFDSKMPTTKTNEGYTLTNENLFSQESFYF